jgi:hypothetical protein
MLSNFRDSALDMSIRTSPQALMRDFFNTIGGNQTFNGRSESRCGPPNPLRTPKESVESRMGAVA